MSITLALLLLPALFVVVLVVIIGIWIFQSGGKINEIDQETQASD